MCTVVHPVPQAIHPAPPPPALRSPRPCTLTLVRPFPAALGDTGGRGRATALGDAESGARLPKGTERVFPSFRGGAETGAEGERRRRNRRGRLTEAETGVGGERGACGAQFTRSRRAGTRSRPKRGAWAAGRSKRGVWRAGRSERGTRSEGGPFGGRAPERGPAPGRPVGTRPVRSRRVRRGLLRRRRAAERWGRAGERWGGRRMVAAGSARWGSTPGGRRGGRPGARLVVAGWRLGRRLGRARLSPGGRWASPRWPLGSGVVPAWAVGRDDGQRGGAPVTECRCGRAPRRSCR